MEKSKKDAYEKGYVKTLFNRKRTIEEIKNTNYLIRSSGDRMALNTPIQGTAADILKLAMIKIYDRLKKENYKSINNYTIAHLCVYCQYFHQKNILAILIKFVIIYL